MKKTLNEVFLRPLIRKYQRTILLKIQKEINDPRLQIGYRDGLPLLNRNLAVFSYHYNEIQA